MNCEEKREHILLRPHYIGKDKELEKSPNTS